MLGSEEKAKEPSAKKCRLADDVKTAYEPQTQKIDGIVEFDFGVYRGDVKDGKPHGHGTLIHTNLNALDALDDGEGADHCKPKNLHLGSMYVGQFKNGKRDGQGVQTNDFDIQREDIYVGQWMDDMMHGKGSMIMAKGGDAESGEGGGRRRMAYMLAGQWENHKLKGTTKKMYADGRFKTRKEEDSSSWAADFHQVDDPDDVRGV